MAPVKFATEYGDLPGLHGFGLRVVDGLRYRY